MYCASSKRNKNQLNLVKVFCIVYYCTCPYCYIQYTNIEHVNTACNYTSSVYNNIHSIKVVTSKVKKTHYRRKFHIQSMNFVKTLQTPLK